MPNTQHPIPAVWLPGYRTATITKENFMSALTGTSVPSPSGRRPAVCPTNRTDVRRRGSAVVGVLLFILVSSVSLIGVSASCTMNQQRATVDLQYAKAMDLAEAGINYELRKI